MQSSSAAFARFWMGVSSDGGRSSRDAAHPVKKSSCLTWELPRTQFVMLAFSIDVKPQNASSLWIFSSTCCRKFVEVNCKNTAGLQVDCPAPKTFSELRSYMCNNTATKTDIDRNCAPKYAPAWLPFDNQIMATSKQSL
jgi:hypothetical protein